MNKADDCTIECIKQFGNLENTEFLDAVSQGMKIPIVKYTGKYTDSVGILLKWFVGGYWNVVCRFLQVCENRQPTDSIEYEIKDDRLYFYSNFQNLG
jgi:hypothetical protein